MAGSILSTLNVAEKVLISTIEEKMEKKMIRNLSIDSTVI